jgi:hypothetical protein
MLRYGWGSATIFAIAAVFFLLSMVAAAHIFALGVPTILKWTTGEAATACAGFATVAAVSLALFQFQRQSTIANSKFALDMAMSGIERSHQVITTNATARNIAWVNGARILLRALAVANDIREPEHRSAWELFKEEWRIRFHALIDQQAEYYFGLPAAPSYANHIDYSDDRLAKLMLESSREMSITLEGRSGTENPNTMLNLRALKAVFDFARFPENYRDTDVLQAVGEFSKADIDALDIGSRWGLFAYLRARKTMNVSYGQVYRHSEE